MTVRQTDLRGPLAIVIGSEGQGLGPAIRRRADTFMRIPMRGAVGSLNAAVAGSILLFEAVAQRDPEGRSAPPRRPTEPELDTGTGDAPPAEPAAASAESIAPEEPDATASPQKPRERPKSSPTRAKSPPTRAKSPPTRAKSSAKGATAPEIESVERDTAPAIGETTGDLLPGGPPPEPAAPAPAKKPRTTRAKPGVESAPAAPAKKPRATRATPPADASAAPAPAKKPRATRGKAPVDEPGTSSDNPPKPKPRARRPPASRA